MNTKQFLFGSLPASDSAPRSLNLLDLQKTGRVFAVVVAGAAATAALDFVTQYLAGVDLGPYRAIIGPAVMGLLELARRWVSTNLVVDNAE